MPLTCFTIVVVPPNETCHTSPARRNAASPASVGTGVGGRGRGRGRRSRPLPHQVVEPERGERGVRGPRQLDGLVGPIECIRQRALRVRNQERARRPVHVERGTRVWHGFVVTAQRGQAHREEPIGRPVERRADASNTNRPVCGMRSSTTLASTG